MLTLYLDASALLRLIEVAPDSDDIVRYVGQHGTKPLVTSAISHIEVIRAVTPTGPEALAHAKRQLGRCYQIPITSEVLERAARFSPGQSIRPHEAIHLVSAVLMGEALQGLVTCDRRVGVTARLLGLPVFCPGTLPL